MENQQQGNQVLPIAKRYSIDDDPLQPMPPEIPLPGEPLVPTPDTEDMPGVGDDDESLGNSHEKPHTPAGPSA